VIGIGYLHHVRYTREMNEFIPRFIFIAENGAIVVTEEKPSLSAERSIIIGRSKYHFPSIKKSKWKKHGAGTLLTIDDFPFASARNGWTDEYIRAAQRMLSRLGDDRCVIF